MRGSPWIVLAAAVLAGSGCRGRVSPMGGGGTLAPNDSGHGGAGTGGLVSSGGMNGTGGAGTGGSGGAILVYDRTLYGNGPGPGALYVDGNDLIWAEIAPQGPIVMRGPKNGSGPVTMLGTWLDGDRTLRLFAADADTIYWLHGWQIHRVRKTGEPLPPLEMGTGHVSGGLISDGDVLRVADLGCKAIGSVPKDGSAVAFIANPGVEYLGTGTDIAVDSQRVYCGYRKYIFSLEKGGQAIDTWLSNQEAAAPISTAGDLLFWANNRLNLGTKQENLAFLSIRDSTRNVSVLNTVGVGVGHLLFDSSRNTIYGNGPGYFSRIFSYNIQDANFAVLLDNTPIFGGFAHDETYVYWVSDTKIWRLPKDLIVPPAP